MRKSIAQKKALEASQPRQKEPAPTPGKKPHSLGALVACIPFGAAAYVCTEFLRGYSFTAFVCVCIIGILLFYSLMPLVGRVLPRFARAATIVFTVALVCGLALFCVTEYFIIRASLGTPEPQAAYVVVLGAKVRESGPSVSLWDRIYKAADFLKIIGAARA